MCGPKQLVVKTNEGVFEHLVAQDHIDRHLGADRFHLGYVSQNINTFLSVTPGERYKILRGLLLNQERLEKVKTAMGQMRRTRQQRYDFLCGKISAFGALSGTTVGVKTEASVDELRQIVAELRQKILSIQSDNNMRAVVMKKLQTLPSGNPESLKAELGRIINARPFIIEWHKYGRPDISTVMAVPGARRAKEYMFLNDELTRLEKITASQGERHRCPSCSQKLVLRNGTLLVQTSKVTGSENETDTIALRDIRFKLKTESPPKDLDIIDRVPQVAYKLYDAFPEGGISDDILNLSLDELDIYQKTLSLQLEGCIEREKLSGLSLPDHRSTEELIEKLVESEERLRVAEAGERSRLAALKKGAIIESELAAEALARSATLLVLAAEAETVYLQTGVSLIFVFADHLMSLMTEGNVRVSFGLENNSIKIIIRNREKETDQSTLSGGESARLNIAFAVTMAVIHKLPFLLLDEATSSLDQETSSLVINIVKSVYDGIIICVSHQAVVGCFDHVITFGDLKN